MTRGGQNLDAEELGEVFGVLAALGEDELRRFRNKLQHILLVHEGVVADKEEGF